MTVRASVIKRVILPVADKMMNTTLMATYHDIVAMQTWSKQEIRDWQDVHLERLIAHFYDQSPFYHDLMEGRGLTPNDIRTVSDLPKLPIMRKADLRANKDRIPPRNISQIKHKTHSSGGSTGEPLRYLLDFRTWSYVTAHTLFSWEKIGYQYGEKLLGLGSASLFPDQNKASWLKRGYWNLRRYYPRNGSNLSEDVCRNYESLLRKENINFIYGYASALYLLARYIEELGGGTHALKACFTTSEILTNEYRRTLERVFQCPVMDCYGSRDGGISAFEMRRNRYHVGYNSLVEIEEGSRSAHGAVLATDLFNYAFPFIRYENGDEVEIHDSKEAAYDYNGQIFSNIHGRISDVIRLENGRVLTGPGFTILFKDLDVRSYRIRKVGRMHIRCEIQLSDGFNSDQESTIIRTFKKHAGQECEIELAIMPEFELMPSGKRNYFFSA